MAALLGNAAIAIAKFVAAGITNSAAMLAEAFHSVADTGNQVLLLFGFAGARRPRSVRHPFGRSKELYFWSLMVAVMLFVGGGVLAVRRGLDALAHPHEVSSYTISFVVLTVAIVIEAAAFSVAWRAFSRERGSRSLWRSIRATKDSAVLVVLLEDSAAMLGLVVALVGLLLTRLTGVVIWDGIASITIGVLLGVIAVILAVETKSLLVGEAAGREERSAIRAAVLSHPAVETVQRLLTMQLGPHDILINLEVELHDQLTAEEIEQVIRDIEASIREVEPDARDIFVEVVPGG